MAKSYTFTKADLAKMKASENKMTDKKRLEVSKALVKANSAANTPLKKKKA